MYANSLKYIFMKFIKWERKGKFNNHSNNPKPLSLHVHSSSLQQKLEQLLKQHENELKQDIPNFVFLT